ncbi:MAG: hypothetical protein JKY09_04225, partial [Crocinitomicaceae bacterium]|nr:hypothetical protein [Crocinitomicaceae bacterium]
MRISGMNKWMMSLAFILKVLIGLCFLFIYTEHYGNGALGGDAGRFMEESKMLNDVFFTSPSDYFKFLFGIGESKDLVELHLHETTYWDTGDQSIINDSKNVLRVHSIIHFFSFQYPFIHILIMCFISLIGVKNLFIGIQSRTKLKPVLLFWSIMLIPSLMFWTSGILKEPFMFLGLALAVRALIGQELLKKRTWLGLLGFVLLLGFKPYL